MIKKVIITGATRGIGRELAVQMTNKKYQIYATGRDQKLLESLKKDTGCYGNTFDLSKTEQISKLYKEAVTNLGGIDILINNAGFNKAKDPINKVTADDLDNSYAVNLRAPYLLCREAQADMIKNGSGHIINIVSTVARTTLENYSVYSAMKYALQGFTGCLIKESQKHNIKVTGIYPGGVDTDFRPNDRPDYMKASSAAKMIIDCIESPEDVVVHEIVFRPIVETNF